MIHVCLRWKITVWSAKDALALAMSFMPNQAAIAALHARAPSFAETDWAQIVALYDEEARESLERARRRAKAVLPRSAQQVVYLELGLIAFLILVEALDEVGVGRGHGVAIV